MIARHRAGLIAIAAPLALATAAAAAAAAAAPINGDVVVFLASAPLWNGSTFDVKDEKMTIRFDNKIACVEKQFDKDNGWLCKADGKVKPGKHKVAVSFTDLAGKPHTLHAALTLKAEDKKLEMPATPDQGEKFWCVSITTAKIELMPKSDARCQTD